MWAVMFAFGSITSLLTSSIIPALAAIVGAVTGMYATHTAHKSQKVTAQDFLMTQYLGFIKSLQDEVNRLNTENIQQRSRIDQQESEIAKLRSMIDSMHKDVVEIRGNLS